MLKKLLIPLLALVLLVSPLYVQLTHADELEDVTKKLDELTKARQDSIAATRPLEDRVGTLDKQLTSIVSQVKSIEADLAQKKADLEKGEAELEQKQQEFTDRVQNSYIRSYLNTPVLALFTSQESASDLTRELVYQQLQTQQDKEQITTAALWIKDLEERKASLEKQNAQLAVVKAKVDDENTFLKKEIDGAKKYQADLSSQIGQLSAKQQELLAAKTGSFSTSVGDGGDTDDPKSQYSYNPGFSPAFAAFSFGAPHRVGMSQYGAFGRSKRGQNAEDIVKAYFSGVELKKDYPVPGQIKVDGYGSISFEDNYMKGIGEMPGSWGDQGGQEALKAQAILARTYALAATNNGSGSICPTESCQVYLGHNKGGNWEKAVNDTKGWVLVKDGHPIKAYYSSTTGGFTRSAADIFGSNLSYAQGIVDTACGNISCWPNDSYEKIAGSPWFYKAWYKNRSGDSGGKSSPWLTQSEMSDIINAALLVQKDSGTTSHISQTDGGGSDAWSADRVKSELSSRGQTPVTSISSVPDPSYTNNGSTGTIYFETNAGRISFSGSFFKQIFNLRAPGRIWIPSDLYNLRMK